MGRLGFTRLLTLVVLLFSPPAFSRDRQAQVMVQPRLDARFSPVRDLLRQQMASRKLPSVTIAIAQHGQIIWMEGFGWADRERQIPATPDTMYRVASVTKPFTATGLMRLVEAGTVGLDNPINDHLGSARLVAYAGNAADATIRRVANHTAGISHHWQFFYSGEAYPAPPTEETLRRYGIIVRPPGDKYEYSNINYAALEKVIETTSGQDYAAYMRDRVFRPLGLAHTAIEPSAEMQPFIAAGYGQNGTRLRAFKTNYPGGADACSSARDLIRFAMFHLKEDLDGQERILSDKSIDEMQRPTVEIGSGRSYGVGWRFDTIRGTVEHGGYFPGASAILRLVPRENAAIVVLTNISNDDQATALNLIADAALRVLIPSWRDPPPRVWGQDTSLPFSGSPKFSGKWTGFVRTWVSDMPLTLVFPSTGEAVSAHLSGQPATSLRNVRYDPVQGRITGEMRGLLNTPDARRSPPFLLKFELKADGGALSGTVTTVFQDMLAPRMSHWVNLTKQ